MDIEIKQGEEKTITLTYADSLDVSGATMSFVAKADLDDSDDIITKVHGDFDMANAATGIVTFDIDNTDTATAQTLIGECTATFSATSLDRSTYITIWIKGSVA